MASVFFRGPASDPKWFARFRDERGKWRSRRVQQQTKEAALDVARGMEAEAERRRLGLASPEGAERPCAELFDAWICSLRNKSAYDDRNRTKNHLVPRFGAMPLREVTVEVITAWISDMRTAGAIAPGTQRHLLNSMSRFFTWSIQRGWARGNPVRDLPPRLWPPRVYLKLEDGPWISGDETILSVMGALPDPFRLMFYIGVMSGARMGEIAGLRLSDVADAGRGVIYCRFSYKDSQRPRQLPAPDDAMKYLGPWIERRRSEGATGEDFLFVKEFGRHFRKEHIEYQWERFGHPIVKMGWAKATRDSFAMRRLTEGGSVTDVAATIGVRIESFARRLRGDRYKLFSTIFLRPLKAAVRLERVA